MNHPLARANGVPDDLMEALAAAGIAPAWRFHAAAPTVAAAMEHWKDIPGAHAKNLFFKDAGGRLWLLTALAERRLDLKTLPKTLGSKRLSFGSAPLLEEVLGVTPGSVTPLAALRDRDRRVTVALDAELMRAAIVNVHPLVNTATIGMRPEELTAFLRACGHEPLLVELGPL
ncbi:MAG TPA: prolyl-tRNA synthetase associated domain-containing protein [Rhodoblastus sp.]|nr:prolyl-tRNA synthetase associated domain-containing protein [Rhodoblastus sp.]